jgi:hypothetical protein
MTVIFVVNNVLEAPRIFHGQSYCQFRPFEALYTPGTCMFRAQKVVAVHVEVCFIHSPHCGSFIESTQN